MKKLPPFSNTLALRFALSTLFFALCQTALAWNTVETGPFLDARAACLSAGGSSGSNTCGFYYLADSSGAKQAKYGYRTGVHLSAASYAEMKWNPDLYPGKGTTIEKGCSGSYYGECTNYVFVNTYFPSCPVGTLPGTDGLCIAQKQSPTGSGCPIHNPIIPSLGSKFQIEEDLVSNTSSNLKFTRYYSSALGFDSPSNTLGAKWRHMKWSNTTGHLVKVVKLPIEVIHDSNKEEKEVYSRIQAGNSVPDNRTRVFSCQGR